MIVGSIKENLTSERRVSLTPETAKNIIGLGLKVYIEKEYASHLGINDEEYLKNGVEVKNSSIDVLNSCNLLLKVNCPSEEEIKNFREKTILVGMFNPPKNKKNIDEMLKKKDKRFFVRIVASNN